MSLRSVEKRVLSPEPLLLLKIVILLDSRKYCTGDEIDIDWAVT